MSDIFYLFFQNFFQFLWLDFNLRNQNALIISFFFNTHISLDFKSQRIREGGFSSLSLLSGLDDNSVIHLIWELYDATLKQ